MWYFWLFSTWWKGKIVRDIDGVMAGVAVCLGLNVDGVYECIVGDVVGLLEYMRQLWYVDGDF